MALCRFLSVGVLLLLLLNIFIKQIRSETQAPVILLAIDNSSSMMAHADSSFINTELLIQLQNLKKTISNNFEVKSILFGEGSKTSENRPDFSEKETDINNLLVDIENNYTNQNIGALVIISDGIYNKGANPIYNSEKLGYPVYSIAIGDTSEIKDVLVQKINHNQFAYLGNIFPVEINILGKQFAGKETSVSLSSNGVKKAEQKLKFNSNNFLATCNFTLSADAPGVQKYTVQINILEGEKNISNNTQSFLIDVIDSRYKILMLANYPHPDVNAIREIIGNNSSYELKYSLSSEFKENLKPYSLVILHGYSPSQAQILSECKNNNIPFWIINPSTTDNLNGIRISASFNKQNDAEPVLNGTFGLFTLSNELKKFINNFPAIKTFFGNYSMSNGTQALINQKIGVVATENPILIFNELNGLKSAVFIGDGLWRWKMRDFSEHSNHNLFGELVGKCIQYLSVKNDKSFFRINCPKIINENERLEIIAEVYNKSYELITEPEVSLILTDSEKKQYNYTFGKPNKQHKLNLGYLKAGEYSYESKVNLNGEVLIKKGIIMVREIITEKINTVANHNLLFKLSNKSGGKMYYPNQVKSLEEDILKNQFIKPVSYSSNQTTILIELKWIFYIILALLTIEWLFRKRYTSI